MRFPWKRWISSRRPSSRARQRMPRSSSVWPILSTKYWVNLANPTMRFVSRWWHPGCSLSEGRSGTGEENSQRIQGRGSRAPRHTAQGTASRLLAPNVGSIAERLAEVRERACLSYRRAAGQPGEPHIVCVTKTQPLPRILEAIDAGATEIGENYLQEAIRKDVFALCESRGVTVRYIGRLQSNKYNAILRVFDT